MPADVDYTRHYQKWHVETPEHYAAMRGFYREFFTSCDLPENRSGRVLDVGCGMGFALLALQELGFSALEGVDVDRGQVEICNRQGLQVRHVDDSTRFLANSPATFDLILCLDVLEHVPVSEQIPFLRAICAALKPGGLLVLTTPNANSSLATRWRYIDWTHTSSFTEHSLDFVVFNGGFTEIDIKPCEFFSPPAYQCLLGRSLLRKGSWARIFHWWIFRVMRAWQRMNMIGELGWEQGRAVPLSLNLLGLARKPL